MSTSRLLSTSRKPLFSSNYLESEGLWDVCFHWGIWRNSCFWEHVSLLSHWLADHSRLICTTDLRTSFMRVVRQPLEASAAHPAHQVWLCSIDSKRSMPGRQPRCPTHKPPIQMQQYKQRWSQEHCNHPAWPREKRIHWSLPMAHVTATAGACRKVSKNVWKYTTKISKQTIARMQYSLGLRCYHLYDSDMLWPIYSTNVSLPKRKSSRDLRMSSDLQSCQTRSLLLDISALVVITAHVTNGIHKRPTWAHGSEERDDQGDQA